MSALFSFALSLLHLASATAQALPSCASETTITVCSFNIQFLGAFKNKDNEGLANLIKSEGCQITAIQELVAPPSAEFLARSQLVKFPPFPAASYSSLPEGKKSKLEPIEMLKMFPEVSRSIASLTNCPGCLADAASPEPIKASVEATRFFQAMSKAGFNDFILSEEDTGPRINHTNSAASEWFVVFFDSASVKPAPDLPHGFLSPKRAGHPVYKRVPYAFPFRTAAGNDFVLISVHLDPGSGHWAIRKGELQEIHDWVQKNSAGERDYCILGDMNIEHWNEMKEILPRDRGHRLSPWETLNSSMLPTNTNPKEGSAKPYDHILCRTRHTTASELDPASFEVVNIREKLRDRWPILHAGKDPIPPYPGDYRNGVKDHNLFRARFSDHHLVKFRMCGTARDDDGK